MKFERIVHIFSRIPPIETPRLLLRKMKVTDAKDMFEYAKRSDVTRYLLWSPHPDLDHTREYLSFLQQQYKSGDFYDWAIILKEKNKMIGTCGFTTIDTVNNSAEIGYVINPSYRNIGIATEAVTAVLRFGFSEMGFQRIEARYMAGNNASRRVMEKCGMHFEGVHLSSMYVKEKYVDVGVCAILREKFIRTFGL